MADVHEAAAKGFSSEAPTYARGRPEYPDALEGWLTGELALGPGRCALDLGAGTGKFTRLVLATGAQVIALEPVDAMRAQLSAKLPQARALAGTAQAIPLERESVDAIVCAQAFHWFATREALAEMHRVLRPGGRLGLVWNVRDESHDWVADITRLITPYEGDTPRFYKGDWRAAFDGEFFGELHERQFSYEHVGTADEVIRDRFMSVSFIASQPAGERAIVERALAKLAATHPALAGRDRIAFPYRTLAFSARRL